MGFKQVILGIAIAVVFAFVVGYGISVFYGDEPKWEVYCKDSFGGPFAYPEKFPGGVVCNQTVVIGDALNEKYNSCSREEGMPVPIYDNATGCEIDVRCDPCQKDYNNARKDYLLGLFIIAVVVGIIGIIVGGILFRLESVGAGLMFGGLLTILYGNIRYWEYFDKVVKFIILFVGLVILIGLGYWMARRRR